MSRVLLRPCGEANRNNASDPRAFAHVQHYPGKLCIADRIVFLPRGFVLGILLHELGHLALLPGDHTEADADQAGGRLAGVTIHRRVHGRAVNLEFVAPKDQAKALWILRRLTNI